VGAAAVEDCAVPATVSAFLVVAALLAFVGVLGSRG
jgi:hypothetical protein